MKNVVITVLATALLVGIGVFVYMSMQKPAAENMNGEEVSNDEIPAVVATVNDEEITREQLETTEFQIAAAQGVDASTLSAEIRTQLRAEALQALISQALLRQAIDDSRTTVASAEVDAQLETIQGQFEDAAAFEAALTQEGLTLATLREQVETELIAQAYLDAELNLSAVTATDEEIQTAYEQLTAATEDAPALEEVRDQVEALVIQQKQQVLVAEFVADLRSDADVETMI